MQFEQTKYIDGKPVTSIVNHASVEAVRNWFDEQFKRDDKVFAVEEINYENGKTSFSLKDRLHKVIIQIKEA